MLSSVGSGARALVDRRSNPHRCCCRLAGLPVVGEISVGGFLEGGDFFPAGRDLALLGIGLRSNLEACQQLMDRDLLGTRRFAVVRDDFEQHQDRMHLDCVFSIVSDNVCLMLKEMIGEGSPTRRLVDEYTKGPDGKYAESRQGVEFRWAVCVCVCQRAPGQFVWSFSQFCASTPGP